MKALVNFHGDQIDKLIFGKTDYNFIKLSHDDLSLMLQSCANNLIKLSTINLEMKQSNSTQPGTVMKELKKLKTDYSFLNFITAPNLEVLELFTMSVMDADKMKCINDFLLQTARLKKFYLEIFCDTDPQVQNTSLQISHLEELTHLGLIGFRYEPRAVAQIIKEHPNLYKLILEDGSWSVEDSSYQRHLKPIFDEIIKLEKLNKLNIEMPTVEFLNRTRYMNNLSRLYINAISTSTLREFIAHGNKNLTKLGIEGIEFGKKWLLIEDVTQIGLKFPNITCFKFDTVPHIVLNAIFENMKNLTSIRIFRNPAALKKRKAEDKNFHLCETKLQSIVCEQEDFYVTVLKILKSSPQLKEFKMFYSDKNTSFLAYAGTIAMLNPKIETIKFKYNSKIFVRFDFSNVIKNGRVSFFDQHFEVLVCKKKGKVTFFKYKSNCFLN
jgi:hypothetical protein